MNEMPFQMEGQEKNGKNKWQRKNRRSDNPNFTANLRLLHSAWGTALEILFGYLNNVAGDVEYVRFTGPVFWFGFVGLTSRLIGLVLALTAGFLLWIKSWPFLGVKKLVSVALLLEGINFVCLIPSLWFLLRPNTIIFTPSLGYGYLIQILFTVPFLWALAYQVAKIPK